MDRNLLIGGIGALAFAVAAVAAYGRMRSDGRRANAVFLTAATLGIALNVLWLVTDLRARGVVHVFRGGDDAALLLGLLLGLVGFSIAWTPTLRGLEGLLFIFAAAAQLAAIFLAREPAGDPTYLPWFISHGLAFAVATACFVAAGCAGVAYRLVYRHLRRKRGTRLAGRVPPLEALERFGRWMMTIGFPIYSYGMLTGVCGLAHREDIRRTAWYLDVSVVLSVLVWIVYGYGLWALIFRPQLRGPRAATLSAGAMVLLVVALISQQFASPIHQ